MNIKRLLIEFFIKKVEAIPAEEIGDTTLWNQCVLWHCGLRAYSNPTSEAIALLELFRESPIELGYYEYVDWIPVYVVNDTGHGHTPKERVLNKLKYLHEKTH
jgi:hypothetical protein